MPSPPPKKRKWSEMKQGCAPGLHSTSKPKGPMDVDDQSGQGQTSGQQGPGNPSSLTQSSSAAATANPSMAPPASQRVIAHAVRSTSGQSAQGSASNVTATGTGQGDAGNVATAATGISSSPSSQGSATTQSQGSGSFKSVTGNPFALTSTGSLKRSTSTFGASAATGTRSRGNTTYQSASAGLMSQGALPTLAPRPAHLAASHQSGISCQPLKITPPSGQEVTYNLDPRQIQTIMMNAATHDMTNTMQVLGTLQPTQPIQANPYLGIAAALEQATRRASQAGSTQQSPATSHGSLPTGSHLPNISLTVIEQILLREIASGNQGAYRLIICMRNVIDNKLMDLWKDTSLADFFGDLLGHIDVCAEIETDNQTIEGALLGTVKTSQETDKLDSSSDISTEICPKITETLNDYEPKCDESCNESPPKFKGFKSRLKRALSSFLSRGGLHKIK